MEDNNTFSNKELLDAISRSGYLLESEISKELSKAGFFIETNQPLLDPITGKTREIDLLAEYYIHNQDHSKRKVSSSIRFVFEIKNNTYPLVLMTDYEHSPQLELWEMLKVAQTIPDGLTSKSQLNYFELLLENSNSGIFTQYCSFSVKKGQKKELMASHPDALHSGFAKIVQHCEEMVERWEDYQPDSYYRTFMWLPVLLIKDELFELEFKTNNAPMLKQVESSKLIYNYHYKDLQKSAVIFITTKSGLKKLLAETIQAQETVEANMAREKLKPITRKIVLP